MSTPDFSTYDRNGIRFLYPTNWLLDESEMNEVSGSLQLNSPSGAFWILKIHPFGTNPEEIAKGVLNTMLEEYADLEYETVFQQLHGKTLIGYEMHFFYLDLCVTSKILCFADETATYAVFWQAGDQLVIGDQKEIAPELVFEAIMHTLLKEE